MASTLTQIMDGSNVINATCIAISEYFNQSTPTTYTLYKEAVPQQLKTPCFFVKMISSNVEKGMDRHRIKHSNIMVQYFPSDTSKKPEEECHIVEDCLYECLDSIWITVLKTINHYNQTYETTQIATHVDFTDSRIVDNILYFNIMVHSNFAKIPAFPVFMNELDAYLNVDPDKDLTQNTVLFSIKE